MRKFGRTLLFVIGVAGLTLVFKEDSEVHTTVIENPTVVLLDRPREKWGTTNEVYRIGLWFSPWYERTMNSSPICGVGDYKLRVLSWSSVVFFVSLLSLWFASRREGRDRNPKEHPA